MDWYDQNCDRCAKGPALFQQGTNEACEIENTIALSGALGGSINDPAMGGEEKAREIAGRLKWDGHGRLLKICPEFEAAKE